MLTCGLGVLNVTENSDARISACQTKLSKINTHHWSHLVQFL